MRFNHIAEDLFSSETSVRILRTLVLRPGRTFTGRELARESGAPPLRALERLRLFEAYGIAQSKRAGRANLWTVNTSHALNQGLRSWFHFEQGLRTGFLDLVRRTLAPLPSVQMVVLFGSVARGDERPDSDIDILIVVDNKEHIPNVRLAVKPLQEQIEATFTNPLRPLIYFQQEMESKRTLRVVQNIEKEGIVVVKKPPVRAEQLDRAKAKTYMQKANEFERSMDHAAERNDWNAVGLMAVHCAISASDALTTHFLGLRSKSQDHEEVAKLLRTLPVKEASEKADHVIEILQLKNLVEYEARFIDESEATSARKRAERFLAWARRQMLV
ncbi:MAG TPA: nucleotidyltransferase domain-containing protein [Candidatus Thermoplasmatota archaeon]